MASTTPDLDASRAEYRTNLVRERPLTATFTPAEGCLTVFDIFTVLGGPLTFEIALSQHSLSSVAATPCWVHAGTSTFATSIFTPVSGLICPVGYTTALAKLDSNLFLGDPWTEFSPIGPSETQFSQSRYDYLLPGETMVLCYPS